MPGMTAAKPLPAVALLLERFIYDREAGTLTWRYGRRQGLRAGFFDPRGYLSIRIDGVLYLAHRLIWKIETGEEPEQIDHLTVDASDNRFLNLRAAKNNENNRNKPLTKSNTSGYKGVWYHKQCGKWCASITVDYRTTYLGLFSDPKVAHEAYLKAAREMHGEFHNPGGEARGA